MVSSNVDAQYTYSDSPVNCPPKTSFSFGVISLGWDVLVMESFEMSRRGSFNDLSSSSGSGCRTA